MPWGEWWGQAGVEEVSDSPSIGLQGVTSHPGFPFPCHSFRVAVETVPVIHKLLRFSVLGTCPDIALSLMRLVNCPELTEKHW